METTTSSVPNFRYFVAPGKSHCSMNNAKFYNIMVDGVSLQQWLTQKVSGRNVENVKCKECNIR
jgi:hypothetical protein